MATVWVVSVDKRMIDELEDILGLVAVVVGLVVAVLCLIFI